MPANVKLSPTEMQVACNAQLLLTKNKVVEKVYQLFGQLSEAFLVALKNRNIPPEIILQHPKISRGENYLGLPWVMLDCPRCFEKENIFSIRTFFWWGNYFSIGLFIKGKYLNEINWKHLIEKSTKKNWRITTVPNPWQHHISAENTKLLGAMKPNAIQALVAEMGFLKLQIFLPIHQWDLVPELFEDTFKIWVNSI